MNFGGKQGLPVMYQKMYRCGSGGAGYLLLLHQEMLPQATLEGWQKGNEGSRLEVRPTSRLSIQGEGNESYLFHPNNIE